MQSEYFIITREKFYFIRYMKLVTLAVTFFSVSSQLLVTLSITSIVFRYTMLYDTADITMFATPYTLRCHYPSSFVVRYSSQYDLGDFLCAFDGSKLNIYCQKWSDRYCLWDFTTGNPPLCVRIIFGVHI